MIDQNWIRPDGTPITGKVPPIVRLRAGKMTPLRQGWISAFYAQFCANKRLCITGAAYFTGSATLPDGTKVRAFSVRGVDYVYIWAGDREPPPGVGVTFWCTPWDDAWLDEAFTEVFTIPRWLEIGPADDEVLASDFLQDLARSARYEPPPAGLYPGNQTWFAPPPHASAGIVVSWWGQMRRYSNSLLDQTIDSAGFWQRPMDRSLAFLGVSPARGPYNAPTGGIAGALAGQLFHQPGVSSLPSGVVTTPVRPPHAAQPRVWVNGAPTAAPVDVSSACLGYRDGVGVLRVVRAPMPGQTTIQVWEQSTTVAGEWVSLGTINISASAMGMPAPGVGVGTPSASWSNSQVSLMHPFYWNADGNEALALAYYRNTSSSAFAGVGAYVLLKLTVGAGGCSVVLEDYSRQDTTATETTTVISTTGPLPLQRLDDTTENGSSESEYVGIVAADYRGNTPVILRTHITYSPERTERRHRSHSGIVVIDTWTGTDSFGQEWTVNATSTTILDNAEVAESGTTTSKASLSGTTIPGTSQTRTYSFSHNIHRTEYRDQAILPNPADWFPDRHSAFPNEDWATEITTTEFSATGPSSMWGISAGDLRGAFVLHAQPTGGGSDADHGHYDSNYDFTRTYDAPTSGGATNVASASFSKNPRTDIGDVLLVNKSGTTELLGRLVHPLGVDELGSGSHTWPDGDSVGSGSSIGMYGDGPSWTDFGMPPSQINLGTASGTTTITTQRNHSRNYEAFSYPIGAPTDVSGSGSSPIPGFVPGASAAAGGYCNTALASCAMTPDAKIQYIGAVFVAMVAPTALTTPITLEVDRWSDEGSEFTPLYPPQPDPDNPGSTMPFPHRGGYSILLDPIFTGPLP